MNRGYFSKILSVSAMLCAMLAAQTVFATGLEEPIRLSFTVPSAPWWLTLPAADFEVAQQELKPNGREGYFFLTDEKTNLNVSFFIEPVRNCNDSKACRDMVWKAGNPAWEKPRNIVSSQLGEISYFEFLIPSVRGQPIRQQNMYAEFVVDGFWVDLHISKVLYKPEEHALFEQLVKAIKFEPKEKKARS
jgi:hypothetical protein